jgi:hypothetical protein
MGVKSFKMTNDSIRQTKNDNPLTTCKTVTFSYKVYKGVRWDRVRP